MWKRIVSLSVGLMFALHGKAALAQSPPAASGPPTVWSHTDWLRLEIIGGRIVASSSRCGQHCLTIEPTSSCPGRQTLKVCSQPDSFTAEYELRTDEATVALHTSCGALTIGQRKPDSAAWLVRYEQPRSGPVKLATGGASAKAFTAASFWHLMLQEPDATARHLLPVLHLLRPDWGIDAQRTELESQLLAAAGQDVREQRRAWEGWLRDLADERFAVRQQADRSLRAAGQDVLAHLRQLDPAGLDVEQERRVTAILRDAAESGADSPRRVASWLLGDKRVWLALVSRGDVRQRVAAASHLNVLLGRKLSFDPQGNEDQWQAQLSELRRQLAEN